MQNVRTLQETHIDAVGPYFFKSVNAEYMNYYVVILLFLHKYLSGNFAQISLYVLPLSSLPHKITHIQTALRQKRSQVRLFRCRFCCPLSQLTADCNRVVVTGLPPSDGTDFNALDVNRLFQMMMEIRNSEDYCRSYIFAADYGNITLRLST